MIKISHRGNISGRQPDKENTIEHISNAIRAGYNVEIDVWASDGDLFLGHDSPGQKINTEFLTSNIANLWLHAKNLQALEKLINLHTHCFIHHNDDATITSKGFIWLSPWVNWAPANSIIVSGSLSDVNVKNPNNLIGVCLDNFNE